jgi:hypothetical protein
MIAGVYPESIEGRTTTRIKSNPDNKIHGPFLESGTGHFAALAAIAAAVGWPAIDLAILPVRL